MPQASTRQDEAHSTPSLAERFKATRHLTEALLQPLSEADATIQSMEDASPAKWHAAHTTWFWETFLLRDHLPDYRLFHEKFPFLFNSYYETEGERISRGQRGLITRPTLAEVLEWRAHVNAAMEPLLEDGDLADLIALGVAHEQQHIELLLTDIKHALSKNPLGPAMWETPTKAVAAQQDGWIEHPGGIARVGHQSDGFSFDNEGPVHRVLMEPFALSRRLVTNGEWAQFIADGGYKDHRLWLSDAWAWLDRRNISAPLYWRDDEHFTHTGWQKRDPDAPVAHISYYEADAFATWAGCRLPSEFEWEAVARGQDKAESQQRFDASAGNQLDQAAPPAPVGTAELFGDVWQFTRSAYLPYPRFQPAPGAVGEYNGKFMAGQWVLKGASCATVRGHSRASYRNFFYPQQRWQFTGLRLAKDV
ncbi:ergothioneine biosynthesis protein EgtB [Aurantiacibacter rhizosphaerae]|uniref:Ergothioneine biosynthesis protein EgtB n=1 Tax=Aurantiacibacter rhizosphaerae TaxID=2691582 RepID=A0A844XFU7_9SPHN|nr:ergothioneine biosynthesis protein EgtB [Aurantiacibacter rhizosphaerae]MWV28464.1 ergothioneine biosynthesis protein EgtB [Aurantiacibacter rhizosphaerae]